MSWLQQYEGSGPTPMKKEDILKNVKYLIPPLYSDGGTPVKISNSPIFSNKSRRLYPEAVNLGFNAEIVLNEIVKEIEKGQWWTSIPEEVVGPDADPHGNPAYREFCRLITADLEHVIVNFIQLRKQLESHQRLSLAAAAPPLSADILELIGTANRPVPSREVLKKYKEEEASRKVGGSKKNKKRKYNKRKSKKSKKSKRKSKKARSKKRS